MFSDGPTVDFTRTGFKLTRWDDSGLWEKPCRLRINFGSRVRTLRKPFKATLRFKRPATVRLRQSDNCHGAFRPVYDTIAFRLLP